MFDVSHGYKDSAHSLLLVSPFTFMPMIHKCICLLEANASVISQAASKIKSGSHGNNIKLFANNSVLVLTLRFEAYTAKWAHSAFLSSQKKKKKEVW